MNRYIQAPSVPLTNEDVNIVLANPALDTIIGMMVGDAIDAEIFTKGEYDRFYIALQCYELDYVY